MKNVNEYPDGTSYAQISFIDLPDGRIIQRINSYTDLWKLGQLIDAYYSRTGEKPEVTIPNLLDAQADDRFDQNSSFGLMQVIRFLANLPANFNIFHPHNPQATRIGFEILGKHVYLIDNVQFIRGVIQELNLINNIINGQRADIGNTVLLSADAGGYKPLIKLADNINWKGEVYSATKARKYENQETVLKQVIDRQDFGGKDVIIVDDICVYGGTFKGLADLLRERNVGNLYLAVSHMTIQNLKGKSPVTSYFDRVFTTNSKFDDYFIEDKNGEPIRPKNLTIIKQFNF